MTSPQSLTAADSESEDELSRITVLVGQLLIDVGVSAGVSISAVVNDVIDLAGDQLSEKSGPDVEFDNVEGKWTFARLTGGVIDPDRSLAETGVYDGEVLTIQQIGAPTPSVLVDRINEVTPANGARRWFAEHGFTAGCFVLSAALAVLAAAVLPGAAARVGPSIGSVPVTGIVALAIGVCCSVAACVAPYRSLDERISTGLSGMALPLIFGGALALLPGGYGLNGLPIAFGMTGLAALIQLLVTGVARPLQTATIVLAVLGAPAAVAQLAMTPNPRVIGSILSTVTVVIVYLAPRFTILLSRLPVPRVPTAGEPLDDIETQGGTTVEGVNAVGKQVIPTEGDMVARVRRATEYLTGTIGAVAVVAVVGCYFVIGSTNGFSWQATIFDVVVATAFCLRGRSHHGVIQSAILIGAGMVIGLVLIVRTATVVEGWQVDAAVALLVFTALLVTCGLVAPRVDFSPVMRRWVEIGEFLAIGLLFPLLCSIIGLYGLFRELKI